ncbi:DUF1911 domain-containing protein [Listeria booriae]|uniref:PoNe immunity protein domain-containing protein n=1 Tax=Listeria booriae TaxID=1552123 RepID=UPI0016260B9F|nr:PoNe immunity protein domain-containing protein [Listeria booriae]MBC1291021.1 DUF1911 domain-containing protein [Listeria booriae]MBC1334807.1 DUF1911 domain-containing protein [Listeria booriae]MBC1648582.1 DUF1911 domain-containing protein [Listeria booriae]MBC6129852.1 DUF1911 domain-containing protein [Listeria booriae]MBC6162610.1 DUF1911 domain-containing protein [Listeria booriae]
MIRDHIKDELYFEAYIRQQKNRIERFQLKLNVDDVAETRIFAIKEKIDALKFQVLIAEYSNGEKIENLKELYKEIAIDMAEFWDIDASYTDILWVLSLGIMLDVSDNVFDRLKTLVLQSDKQDYLLRFLLNYRDKSVDFSDRSFLYEEPYMFLKNVINADKNTAITNLQIYLQNIWYKGNADSGWYDIHNEQEKLYYGYWSFESGAIATIMGLDDTSLKGAPFYPYDLVHYKNQK